MTVRAPIAAPVITAGSKVLSVATVAFVTQILVVGFAPIISHCAQHPLRLHQLLFHFQPRPLSLTHHTTVTSAAAQGPSSLIAQLEGEGMEGELKFIFID